VSDLEVDTLTNVVAELKIEVCFLTTCYEMRHPNISLNLYDNFLL
jgi:hypothetical protein